MRSNKVSHTEIYLYAPSIKIILAFFAISYLSKTDPTQHPLQISIFGHALAMNTEQRLQSWRYNAFYKHNVRGNNIKGN